MELDDLAAELQPQTQTGTAPASFNEEYDKFVANLYNEVCSWADIKREAMMADATQRFSTALPLHTIEDVTVALIGAGGLGNWIWRVLLGMGFTNLAIFDDDTVGVENIGPQAHNFIDIGHPKVEAIRRAALAFRGVNLRVFSQRISHFSDLEEALGYMPAIVIGATDSADFRNGMINELRSQGRVELFIDLRMSLGDWNAYITTPQMMCFDKSGAKDIILENYIREACFSSEEAVHEPCTARAITYTGANVASYVGAFLHWWFTTGRTTRWGWFKENFYTPYRSDSKTFNWAYTYSSRDFSAETKTVAQHDNALLAAKQAVELAALRKYFDDHNCIGAFCAYDQTGDHAVRGVDGNGNDVLRVYHYTTVLSLNLDTEAAAIYDDEADIPKLIYERSYGRRGWQEIAAVMRRSWLDEEVVRLLLREMDGKEYVLTLRDGKAELYTASVSSDNLITLEYPVPLTCMTDNVDWGLVTCLNNSDDYTVIHSEDLAEPEPEPEPEPDTTMSLALVPIGNSISILGTTYKVIDKHNKVGTLKDEDGNIIYIPLYSEVTCC